MITKRLNKLRAAYRQAIKAEILMIEEAILRKKSLQSLRRITIGPTPLTEKLEGWRGYAC